MYSCQSTEKPGVVPECTKNGQEAKEGGEGPALHQRDPGANFASNALSNLEGAALPL